MWGDGINITDIKKENVTKKNIYISKVLELDMYILINVLTTQIFG